MLKQRREKQQQMELVIMEQMVPEDHFLRKVDRAVDFSFIYDLCAPLYCADNGRPAIDPEILFRMLLVGYLYGIKSEARLEEEINYNIAYKWFCGLDSPLGKATYALRSQTIERVFADAKEKHAMRYTPYRGLTAVTAWVKLKFAAMNLKKLAIHKWRPFLLFLLFSILSPSFLYLVCQRSPFAFSQGDFFDRLRRRELLPTPSDFWGRARRTSYSTVTLLARLRGLSTSRPLATEM